jgi:Na+/serine symporter
LTSAQAILYGTLVAGTLDILDALIVSGLRGVTPLRLFQYIAAGLLGRDAARAGGLATAFLGGFLHYFIAFGAVVVYFVASRKIPFLTRRPWIVGPIYGALVYLFMNLVVLPLSALHRAPDFTPSLGLLNQLLIHTFGIGVPCALFARAARPSAPRPEAVLVA